MFLYNTTVMVEEAIHTQWLAWAREYLVGVAMESGTFVSNRILKVVDSPNEGVTYCIQFVTDSRKNLDDYLAFHDPAIQQLHAETFGNRFVSFSTIMEYID